VEACEAFTIPYPLKVMCRLLGIPTTQEGCSALGMREAPADPLAALREWSVHFAVVTGHFGRPPAVLAEAFTTGWVQAQSFFKQILDAYRRYPEKEEAIIVQLLRQEGQEEAQIRPEELASTLLLLSIAGVYNTSNALASTLRWSLQLDLEQRTQVLADDQQLRTLVKACLFHDPSAHWVGRVAEARVNVGETWIEKGERVLLCLAAEAPGEPIPGALPQETISFGHGPHYCIGSELALSEVEIGIRAFFERFPNTWMETQEVHFHNPTMRGIEALWIHL
jgi:cytochrome P450